MKLLVDDADITKIRKIYEYFPVCGVTTNPTILMRTINKTGKSIKQTLTEIRDFIGKDSDLHVQVTSEKAEEMVKEGITIAKALGENTFIKVPCINEGFKAIKLLVSQGLFVTGTAVYTPLQAYLASECGASWVAPYVSRIDNLGMNGIQTATDIQDILRKGSSRTKVLGASFKLSQQVLELCKYGIDAATISSDLILNLVNNPTADSAVSAFKKDFKIISGSSESMAEALC